MWFSSSLDVNWSLYSTIDVTVYCVLDAPVRELNELLWPMHLDSCLISYRMVTGKEVEQ